MFPAMLMFLITVYLPSKGAQGLKFGRGRCCVQVLAGKVTAGMRWSGGQSGSNARNHPHSMNSRSSNSYGELHP